MSHAVDTDVHVGNELLILIKSFYIARVCESACLRIEVSGSDVVSDQHLVQSSDVVSARPLILISFCQRCVGAVCLDCVKDSEELIPCCGNFKPQLIKDVAIVSEYFAVKTERNAVDHSVIGGIVDHLRFNQAVCPLTVCLKIRSEIEDKIFADESL